MPTINLTPQMRRVIRRTPNLAATSRGIAEFGVYAEFVNLNSSGQVYEVIRMFAAREMLCTYQRRVTDSRTVWRGNKANGKTAVELMEQRVAGLGRMIMRGAPMLVQLEPSDVDQLNKNVMPNARYRGSAAFEKLHGALPTDLQEVKVNELNAAYLTGVKAIAAVVVPAIPAPPGAAAVGAAPTVHAPTAAAPVMLDDEDEDEDVDYGDEPF